MLRSRATVAGRRARARSAPALGAVPAAIALQRMAGNHATTRLIQRVQVTGTATPKPEGKQQHHPDYRFTYPNQTEPRLFALDDWVTGKLASPAVAHAAANAGVRNTVTQAVQNWNGNATIVGTLVDQLIAATPVVDWRTADVTQAALGPDPVKSIVPLLLSLKGNIKLREDDRDNNVPTKIKVVGNRKVKTPKTEDTDKDYTIGWDAIMRDARLAMKAKLTAAQPQWAPARKEDVKLLDDVIKTSTDPALVELKRINYLIEKDNQWKTAVKPPQTGSGGSVINYKVTWTGAAESFNFGLGHLRFILFMEWKLLSELLR